MSDFLHFSVNMDPIQKAPPTLPTLCQQIAEWVTNNFLKVELTKNDNTLGENGPQRVNGFCLQLVLQ